MDFLSFLPPEPCLALLYGGLGDGTWSLPHDKHENLFCVTSGPSLRPLPMSAKGTWEWKVIKPHFLFSSKFPNGKSHLFILSRNWMSKTNEVHLLSSSFLLSWVLELRDTPKVVGICGSPGYSPPLSHPITDVKVRGREKKKWEEETCLPSDG